MKDQQQIHQILFDSLRTSGFIAPAANDIANKLTDAILRGGSSDVAALERDINDIIKSLSHLKATI